MNCSVSLVLRGRRRHAEEALQGGQPAATSSPVQRAVGHSTATTTLNTYSHLWPTAEDRTRMAASDLIRQAMVLPA